MKIYSTDLNKISFGTKRISPQSKLKKITEKEDFYNNIRHFLNKDCDKQEYFTLFRKNVDAIIANKNAAHFTKAEKIYINDMLTTLDLNYDVSTISEEYITSRMKRLLENQK